jgi:murein L,D-transpeptidase YcbB/YkuD
MTQARKTLGLAALGLAAFALITGVVFVTRQNASAVPEPGLQAAIRSSVDRAPYTRWHGLYQERAYTPVWLLPSGPSSDARAVMGLLTHAADQGLSAARYRVDELPAKGASKQTVAAFEMRLTRAAFAYAYDMQFGVLRPSKLFDDVSLAPRKDDALAQFEQAVSQGDVAGYLQSLEPQVGEYRALKAGLARYRQLAAHPWAEVRGGDKAGLAARLAAEGYVDANAVAAGQRLSPAALADALKAYQTANGLDPDGKLDGKTLAMLNVPPARRAQQIAVNMERWRWLPRVLGARHVMVNVAGASLVLVENGEAAVTSRVVVGAPDKPTPILATEAVAITVNPVWHLPKSIVEKEIEPKLADDPDYLENKDMERTPDGDIIQHAGPQNALGTVKFEMPNDFDVYMHDTPSKRGFLADDRALSHGCVRVERIGDLAQHVLQLSETDLSQKIASGETSRQPIKPAVPVYIQYWTAVPTATGTMGFRPDIYDRDTRMIEALAQISSPSLASAK